MIKYFTLPGSYIGKKDIIRETKNSVFIIDSQGSEREESKTSSIMNYFDLWEDAHDFLWRKEIKNVSERLRILQNSEKELRLIKKRIGKKDRKSENLLKDLNRLIEKRTKKYNARHKITKINKNISWVEINIEKNNSFNIEIPKSLYKSIKDKKWLLRRAEGELKKVKQMKFF